MPNPGVHIVKLFDTFSGPGAIDETGDAEEAPVSYYGDHM